MAALFAQAGCFPREKERPDVLGGEEQLHVQYVLYQNPAEFIYTHPITQRAQINEADLETWHQAHQARLAQYQLCLKQPSPAVPSARTEKSEGSNEQALQLGSLVHNALARHMTNPTESILQAVQAVTVPDNISSQEEAAAILQSFYQSDVFTKMSTMKCLAAEMPFSLQTQQGIVNGVMDLLLQEKDGTLWVVDYKTDQVPAGQEKTAALAYQPQVAVYMQAIQKMYPQHTVRGAIVLVRPAVWVEVPASGKEL